MPDPTETQQRLARLRTRMNEIADDEGWRRERYERRMERCQDREAALMDAIEKEASDG